MPDINGIPYVESTDLVSAYPAASQSLAQAVSDELASKLPYSYGTATPSTTTSGFLWYDSNATPPTPKYWNGSAFANLAPSAGLIPITTASLSGSSTSINGCFSADYIAYRIFIYGTSSESNTLLARLRVSGSDNTSSNYAWARIQARASLSQGDSPAGLSTSWVIGFAHTANGYLVMDLVNPYATAKANFSSSGHVSDATTNTYYAASGHMSVTTSYDSITFLTNTGTFGGTANIYAYENA